LYPRKAMARDNLDFGHSGQAWQRRSARRGRGGGAGER
jgi:hypothetical protein